MTRLNRHCIRRANLTRFLQGDMMNQKSVSTYPALLTEIAQPLLQRLSLVLEMGAAVINHKGEVIAANNWHLPCSTLPCLHSAIPSFQEKWWPRSTPEPVPATHRCAGNLHFASAPIVISRNLVAFMVIGPFHLPGTNTAHQETAAVPAGYTCPLPETVPVLVGQQLTQHLAHLQTTAELIGFKGEQGCSAMDQQAVEPDSAWQTLFAQAPFAMTISRLSDGKLRDCNPAWTRFTGQSREKCRTRFLQDFIDIEPGISPDNKQFRGDQGDVSLQERLFNVQHAAPCHFLQASIPFTAGSEEQLISIFIDISQHKRTEKALRSTQEYVQSFFQAVPMGLVVSNKRTLLTVNKKFCEITGYSPEELINQSTRRLYLNDQEFERVHQELISSMWGYGQPGTVEASCVCKDGSVRDIALFAAPIDPNNRDAGAAIAVQDITEQKLDEEALRLSRDKLQGLFRAAPLGLAVIRERHLYSVNEQICQITGYDTDELILLPVRQLYESQEEYNRVGQALYSTLWQTGRTEIETRIVTKGGELRDIHLSISPIDLNNSEAGVVVACQDITQRKKIESALRNQQATLQSLFNAVPVGLAIITNRTLSAVNKRLADITGWAPAKLINTSTRMFYENNEEFFRIREELYGELWRSGRHKYVETKIHRPDGTVRDVSLFAAPIDPNDPELGAAVALQDITEQKQILRKIKENEERFRAIADFTGQLLYDYDVDNSTLIWSGRAEDMTGYPLAELNLQGFDGWIQHVHSDDRDQVLARLQRAMEQKTIFQAEYRLQKADTSFIHVEDEGAFFYDEQQRAVRMLGIIRDINTRKLTEDALKESENRYRTLFESSGNAIMLVKNDIIIDCNLRTLECFRATREQIIGKSPKDLSPDVQPDGCSSQEKGYQIIGEAMAGTLTKFEWVHQRCDGEPFYAEIYLNPIEFSGTRCMHASMRDITDRKGAEKALRESEFRFRSFYNTNPEGIVLLDFQGLILDANKAFLKESGYSQSQCIGHHFKDFVCDETEQARIVQAIVSLKSGFTSSAPLELSYRSADGTIFPVAVKGWLVVDEDSTPIYIGVFIKNLSKEKALAEEKATLEKQIIQSQKSEAIGTLAGGIAHDFNNILGGLIGYTELALLKTPLSADNKVREYLQRALEIGLRAKDLVQQILRFSRHSKTKMEPVNVSTLVKESVRLLRSTIPSTIEIRQEIDIKQDRILGDATQIHQVLMNLATNAYHAMRESGGVLTFSLEQVHLPAAKRFLTMEIAPGDYLKIRVRDTGAGIPRHVLERIFEPYFTTKVVNEGTGLGLAVTMGIIKGHQGLIEVETVEGQGTCFSLFLPLSNASAEQQQTADIRLPVGHGERILVVDDEEFFREVIREGLSLLGYEVTVQPGSLQALAAFKDDPQGFDLLLTDQTMPDMTGTQLAQHVLAIKNFMPIILCTGFSETITDENASNFGIAKLLMKPINLEELATAVHSVLTATQPGTEN